MEILWLFQHKSNENIPITETRKGKTRGGRGRQMKMSLLENDFSRSENRSRENFFFQPSSIEFNLLINIEAFVIISFAGFFLWFFLFLLASHTFLVLCAK